MAVIGKVNTLSIIRESAPGLYLDGGELGEILFPKRYIPRDLKQGDTIDAFVYLDSEDRLVATTEKPYATVGEFAHLEVVSVHQQVGAFLKWGLAKDLLLPFREQEGRFRIGDKLVVAICLDPKSNRLVASMKVRRHFSKLPPPYRSGDPVTFMITDMTRLGYKAIVENLHEGLLFHDKLNLAEPLPTGLMMKGFVRGVSPSGKIDLSLDATGYKRVKSLQEQVVAALQANGGRLNFDDSSSPELIRQKFSVSKKAFKQALGSLYKTRRIAFLKPGVQLLDNSSWQPGQ
ncbi:MAG: hypothetical protein RL380_1491 [Verrucomicrobiota bacterium]